MPNNNARVGSTFQTSGKYWQYASMVRLSNVKDTGEVCYNIVKTLGLLYFRTGSLKIRTEKVSNVMKRSYFSDLGPNFHRAGLIF